MNNPYKKTQYENKYLRHKRNAAFAMQRHKQFNRNDRAIYHDFHTQTQYRTPSNITDLYHTIPKLPPREYEKAVINDRINLQKRSGVRSGIQHTRDPYYISRRIQDMISPNHPDKNDILT